MVNTYKGYNVGVPEAPADGSTYARQDGTWVTVAGGTPEVYVYADLASFPASGASNTLYVAKDTKFAYYWDSAYVKIIDGEVEVFEYDDLASFPVTGVTGKIYTAKDANKIYRWTGSAYAELSPSSGGSQEVFVYANLASFPVTGTAETLYVAQDTKLSYIWGGSAYVGIESTHNNSQGLQGGSVGEYYHLTEQQRALILGINGAISTTLLSNITVTDNGDGTVSTGSCIALLKASTDLNAEAHAANLTGIGPISLDIGKKYFLVSDWNSGTPIQRIEESTSSTINNYTISLIGILTRGISGDIYWTDIGQNQLDAVSKITRRINDESGLIVKTQGGLVSSSAGRYLQITAARYYISNRLEETPAFDTTGTDRFSQLYGDSTAGFTEVTDLAQLNNTQYWNSSTHSLTALSASRFAIRWIFQLIDSPNEVYSWIGTEQFTTLASARAALITTDLPIQLQPILNVSVLIAKVIIQEGQANVIEVDNIVNINTQAVATSDHNQLSTLQGGQVGEYYHLTAQRHETLSELADGRFSPVSDSTTAFQITKADETTPVLIVDTTSGTVSCNKYLSGVDGVAALHNAITGAGLNIYDDATAYFTKIDSIQFADSAFFNYLDLSNTGIRNYSGTLSNTTFRPLANSTSAMKFTDYGNTETILNIDTTNKRVCIGNHTTLAEKFTVYDGNISLKTQNITPDAQVLLSRADTGTTAQYIASIGMKAISDVDWRGIITFNRKELGAYNDNTVSESMRISENGYVGVGVTAPLSSFHVGSVSDVSVAKTLSNSVRTWQQIVTSTNGHLYFRDVTGGNKDGFIMEAGVVDYQLYLKSGGNVGVGTASPSEKLTVNGTMSLLNSSYKAVFTPTTLTADRTYTFPDASGTIPLLNTSNIFTGGCEFTNLSNNDNFYCKTSGTTYSMLAGTSSQGQRIAICGGSTLSETAGAFLTLNGNTFGSGVSGWAVIQCGSASGARVALNGPVLTPTTYALSIGSAANVYIDSNGLLYRSTSALKYKENISSIEDISDFIYGIVPVKYQSKCQGDLGSWHFGIIADQVDSLCDEGKMLVTYGETKEDGTKEVEGFQYERLTVLLLAELQKQHKKIAELEARLELLETN